MKTTHTVAGIKVQVVPYTQFQRRFWRVVTAEERREKRRLKAKLKKLRLNAVH